MWRTALLVVLWPAFGIAADDFTKLVESALKEEIAEFDAIEERWEKKKLKPAESVLLFGKKKLSADEQAERMKEVRKQVEAGEVSFRVLSLSDDLVIGQVGVIAPTFQPIVCSRAIEDGFFGGRAVGTIRDRGEATT